MRDWGFAQNHPNEELALLRLFSGKKQQAGSEIEFTITGGKTMLEEGK